MTKIEDECSVVTSALAIEHTSSIIFCHGFLHAELVLTFSFSTMPIYREIIYHQRIIFFTQLQLIIFSIA